MKSLLFLFICFFCVSNVFSQGNNAIEEVTKKQPKIRLSITGGFGYMTSSSKNAEEKLVDLGFNPDDVNNYYSDLKFSFPVNAGIHYFITPEIGLGISYNFFTSKSETKGVLDIGDAIHSIYTTMSERFYINFAGISLLTYNKFVKNEKFGLTAAIAPGMTFYRNEAKVLNVPILITGKTFGLNSEIGLEYNFSSKISVGAEINYLLCSLHKITVDDGTSINTLKLDKENYENISRINFSVGIRFYF